MSKERKTSRIAIALVTLWVVFTVTFDGTVYAFDERDGVTLWKAKLRAGNNACPALAGDTLLVGAGVPRVARAPGGAAGDQCELACELGIHVMTSWEPLRDAG
jgi:outer membrane protein assembly factor BamB